MQATGTMFGRADLTTCDSELIHIPGSVEPHGVMLVLDPVSLVVRQAAGAAEALLGLPVAQLPGTALSSLVDPAGMARLQEFLADNALGLPLHLFDIAIGADRRLLDLSLFRNDGGIVLEAEAADPDPKAVNPLSLVQAMISTVSRAETVLQFCQAATEQLHTATGYDRVMIYRFLPDDTGSVVAETVAPGVEGFLGLRYPATDIPQQARALYLLNWLRILADIDAPPAPLQPVLNPVTLAPLDMSFATLRSVSPVHLEYLRNMGVQATMTVSLIKDGRLWGLIACHHGTAKQLPRRLRAVCELFGNMFALQLDARERAETMEYRHRSSRLHAAIVGRMAGEDELAAGLINHSPSLLDYIEADGVALLVDGRYQSLGRTPREEQVRLLALWLDGTTREGCYVTNSLCQEYPAGMDFAVEATGVLAISASRSPSDYIIWFRAEMVENVRWAGEPTKAMETGPLGDRLTPRKSFEEWVQSVRYQARPWTENEIEAAALMRTSLLEVVLRRIDELARQRQASQSRHELMVAELNHRVKNTLSTIQALARYTHQSSDGLEAYVNDFEKRIQAMTTSHNLLSEASWEQTSLRTLVAAQLEPYAGGHNLVLEGEEVAILSRAAAPLGMVFHELTTNAVKYGALSAGGRITVRWRVGGPATDRWLTINWMESGGPPVVPPKREGFGTFTINRIIPFQCDGRTRLDYAPSGVLCDIELGPECFDAGTGAAATPVSPGQAALSETPRILVVEDETIIAFMIEKIVVADGYQAVGPVARLTKGLDIARSQPLSGALLDVNLNGELSWPLARVLRERGVPFLFMTGYTHTGFIPPEFQDVQVLSKPIQVPRLREALQKMVRR